VLIVDDNHETADSLATILRFWGHRAMVAYSGHAALQRASETRPDVVLIDLDLPDTDGFEVARQLRLQDAARDQPVRLIALSGTSPSDDPVRWRRAQFEQAFTKPVDFHRLERALKTPCTESA
jgi:CheY-like chemotaxis protein